MDSPELIATLLLSLRIALLSTVCSLPLALGVAWILTRRRFPGRTVLDALVHAPLVLPPVVVGYGLLILLGGRSPLGQSLGLHLAFSTTGAVLAAAVMSFPLMVRAIRVGLESIDQGLEVAARTLGASPLDAFLTVSLPLMFPGILAGATLAFAAALGEFGATMTFAANIPGETRTLTLAIYTALQSADGDATARTLVLLSMGLAVAALLLAEWSQRLAQRWNVRA